MRAPWPLLCLWLCALLIAAAGCSPKIGNACGNALNCSAQGSRLCDRTQPGGYCTIAMCEEGTCPPEAVCVKFRPQAERYAVTYCMRKCSKTGDCRSSEGYQCTSAKQFGDPGAGDALILGNADQKFCSIPALMPTAMAASSMPASSRDDAGRPDAGTH
jgi:hypothetical protein